MKERIIGILKFIVSKKCLFHAGVLCFIILVLALLQGVLMPKYVTSIHEGNLVHEYYDEKMKHDVIFIGDCEVFSNFSPVKLWEDYGVTSYIRGSAQQLIWQSYYLLEETLQYEKPKAVVFNVLAMKYDEPQKEAYNRLTLDGMKLSSAKIGAINASMMEDEAFITYLFPILRYHTRWNELTSEDFRYLFDRGTISHNGFLMRIDVKPVVTIPRAKKLANYRFGENSYAYLDRMTKLCKENGIELILIKSPSLYPHWYEEWDEQMAEYAGQNDLTYINFLKLVDEAGIDFTTDTYDSGLHLNLSGAEKLSEYFGEILRKNHGLADHRGDPEYESIWEEKVKSYYEMKADQERELAEYGYLKSYGAAETNAAVTIDEDTD